MLSGNFWRTRSVPRCALLRARPSRANPQALLPLSLPDARRRTGRARRTSGGFAPPQGCRFLCGSRLRSLRGNAKGVALSFPKAFFQIEFLPRGESDLLRARAGQDEEIEREASEGWLAPECGQE